MIGEARQRQRRRRFWSAAALALVLVTLAGIWGSPRGGAGELLSVRNATQSLVASQAAASLPNPCTLLTNGQVGGLIGGRVVSRRRIPNHVCTWTGPVLGPLSTSGTEFDLQVKPESRAAFEAYYAAYAQQSGIAQTVRVAGIGESAFSQYNVDFLRPGITAS